MDLRQEVTEILRKYGNELHNLYSSQNIMRLFKSRRTGWSGNEGDVIMYKI
jgi:hypothetical protein